jgi:acetolactate synthase-1/3 small subunit
MIVEITGDPEKINAFVNLMQPYGIKEISRTGVTAMHRGIKSVRDSVK